MSAEPIPAALERNPLYLGAAALAARGWYVLPMEPVKPGEQKRPAVELLHGFLDASTDAAQVRKWWEARPDCLVAVALEPSGLADLDLDVDHEPGQDGIREAQALGWTPAGPLIHTAGGGLSALYRAPGNGARPARNLPDGIEVRLKGARIVPPSRIGDAVYTWERPATQPLPELPEWALASEAEAGSGQAPAGDGMIPPGKRHNHLLRLAGAMRAKGATVAAILAGLQAENVAHCGEPMPPGEVRSIANSMQQYEAGLTEYAEPDLRTLAAVKPEALTWTWPGKLPVGKLGLLVSDPGEGKSTLALDMASRVSSGTPWPDATDTARGEPGDVLLLSAEDDAADTIVPRAMAAGADLSRIVLLEAVREHDKEGTESVRAFDLTKDIERLDAALDTMARPRLIIIDPLSAYLGRTDSNNNTEVRATLAPLQELAQRRRVAVLGITHLRKSSGKAAYRAMGSLAFVAAARVVWGVARDGDDDSGTRRLLLPIKQNLSKDTTGMAFSIVSQVVGGLGELPRVQWERTPIAQPDVERHLSGEEDRQDSSGDRKLGAAEGFLRTMLASGPVPTADVEAAADQVGISEGTLKNARRSLHVRSKKQGTGPWVLSLRECGGT